MAWVMVMVHGFLIFKKMISESEMDLKPQTFQGQSTILVVQIPTHQFSRIPLPVSPNILNKRFCFYNIKSEVIPVDINCHFEDFGVTLFVSANTKKEALQFNLV